jgi:hypothetical protein
MVKKNVTVQPLSFGTVFRPNYKHMKKLLMMVLVCLSINTYAQDTETRKLGPFRGIKAAEGVSVYLKKGDKESARIEVTGVDASHVLTELSGSYLKIHMKDGNYRNVNAKVYVTYVELEKLSASSAGSIFSEDVIKGNDMEISASSAGTIEVSIDANSVDISSSSAAEIELKGKVKSLIAEASSAGEIDTYDLEAGDVDVEASSAGSAKVNVSKSLRAHASSGGSIRYRGNPDRQNTDSSSGGSVKKSN